MARKRKGEDQINRKIVLERGGGICDYRTENLVSRRPLMGI